MWHSRNVLWNIHRDETVRPCGEDASITKRIENHPDGDAMKHFTEEQLER